MTLPSLETWSDTSQVAVVVLGVLAALAGASAWYFSGRVGAAKDAAMERFKTESAATIALADARSAEANTKALEASRGTAEALAAAAAANERASKLELETELQRERAAKAENDLLVLKNQVAFRKLTEAQRAELIRRLSNAKSAAVVVSPIQDAEANDFADDIDSVLRKASWETLRIKNRITSLTGLLIGAVAGTKLSEEAEALINAFSDMGITHKVIEFKEGDASTSPAFQRGFLYIVIEHKPGPWKSE